MRRAWPLFPITFAIAAAACAEQRPAVPTEGEAAQLDEIEAMLDAESKEEGPADRSTGPSNGPSDRQ